MNDETFLARLAELDAQIQALPEASRPPLLALVAELVRELGFTVSVSTTRVQVSRKAEVQDLENLLQFRRY